MARLMRAMHPNKGLQAAYAHKLRTLVKEMCRSTEYWLTAAYRQNEERITGDAKPKSKVPGVWMQWALRRLQSYWLKRFKEQAEKFARWFVHKNQWFSATQYKSALKAMGATVKLKPSRATNDVVSALIEQNVSLIKSIHSRYFAEVTELVQRSVVMGRDVDFLRDELKGRFAMTDRRAKLIARDQNNKAFQAIKRSEADDLGITEAVWVHVPGSKSSRETHMRFNGKRFNIHEGLYDSDVHRKVVPGELISCNCTQRLVLPDFGD